MTRNVTHRERRGHRVAFGDDSDVLDAAPLGRRLRRPQAIGAPHITNEDVSTEEGQADTGEPPASPEAAADRGSASRPDAG
jgi:hypothetical protein